MRIGAVLCAKNEAHIIEEWIAHHLALGIERIHIFDNLSTDGTREKIERVCSARPGVTCETWDHPPVDLQRDAYDHGLQIMTAEDVEWCAFVDADEFIANASLTSSETLADMLGRHANHCAIGLHWVIFGSSGHVDRPGGLTQENFLMRAVDGFPVHRHIKSIVRPRYTMGAHHAHGFSLDTPYFTPGGEEISWTVPYAYADKQPDIGGWRLNHYFCQCRAHWEMKVRKSRERGQSAITRVEAHWAEHDRNEVFDPSALRWTSRDRTVMASFGRWSGLAAADAVHQPPPHA